MPRRHGDRGNEHQPPHQPRSPGRQGQGRGDWVHPDIENCYTETTQSLAASRDRSRDRSPHYQRQDAQYCRGKDLHHHGRSGEIEPEEIDPRYDHNAVRSHGREDLHHHGRSGGRSGETEHGEIIDPYHNAVGSHGREERLGLHTNDRGFVPGCRPPRERSHSRSLSGSERLNTFNRLGFGQEPELSYHADRDDCEQATHPIAHRHAPLGRPRILGSGPDWFEGHKCSSPPSRDQSPPRGRGQCRSRSPGRDRSRSPRGRPQHHTSSQPDT